MIFGDAPSLEAVLASVEALNNIVNNASPAASPVQGGSMSDYFSGRGTVQALINSGAFGTFDVAGSIMQRAAHAASNVASNAVSGICFSWSSIRLSPAKTQSAGR